MAAAQGGGGAARPELGPEAPGSATVEPAAADSAVPSPAVQRAELRPLMAASMRLGESWYLLSSRWFGLWKRYVGYDRWDVSGVGDPNLFPGPIDNACLLNDGESQSLKEHLIAQLDYVLVPSSAWQKLVSWYGCIEGQQPIVRKVMEFGLYAKHCEVEVYPLELKLCESSSASNVISCCFSRRDSVATLVKEIRKLFQIPAEKDVRLWSSHFDGSYEQLSDLGVTLEDANIYHGELVLIEVKNEDGTWPQHPFLTKSSTATSRNFSTSSKPSASSYSSASATSVITNGDSSNSYGLSSSSLGRGGSGFACNSYSSRDSASLSQPGLCGLSNLGNTCFMNSALQCLSNTPPLTEYFLEDKYEAEINHSNPLGMRGEIAEAYAELIKQIWSGRQSHVAPRMFKTQVGRFAPQFSGYQQQDSQELLAFLLDGLHEDLNRVKKKPYLELKDANGRPDSVVAKEAWENHRLRNDSVIVDIFHGLFKSTLVCPKCSKVSVTFDPFCYLTLPLPLKRDRLLEVTLVFADPQRRPVQYRVVVPMMGAISDLCESLSKLSGVPAENMVVTDVYNHRFHKIFQADEGLNHIMPKDDIFVYEVCKPSEDGSEYITFSLYFREKAVRQSSSTSGTILFGQPLLISVPKHKLTVDHLYGVVLERISRYVKLPVAEEYSTPCPGRGACNGSSSVAEGDIEEMEHQDDGPECREKLAEVDPCHTEGCMQVEPTRDVQPCKKQHFTFSLVNLYGTSEINSIVEGKLLKLNAFSTLAIDWDSDTRRLLFDEQEAQACEKHASVLQPQKMKAVVALKDCIELFTTMETLGEHDPWYCPNCKKHQQATKKFDLWSLPKILVVHLKRFSYSRYWRDKLDTVVEFPIRGLNMSEFVCDPRGSSYVYDLIAVSNHYGAMGVGHYTAYAKNKVNGKWYYFDDSSVSLASEDQIVTKAAYVLFYQRRNDEEHVAPSPPQEECDGMDTN
ncbi:ubiquitin carboxyl-terminal hydrolase 4 [Lagopus muta]|uniref:ubiquitin carboxyl-terminal hydrolase 4 n=1 Tax=Lagopus muta TaxID=64668 RepID=UPI00209CE846|nr:ubiquitin carboxyl-terminal hydrolase 4 [Lagopus muta]